MILFISAIFAGTS